MDITRTGVKVLSQELSYVYVHVCIYDALDMRRYPFLSYLGRRRGRENPVQGGHMMVRMYRGGGLWP